MRLETEDIKLLFKERVLEILMTIYFETLEGRDVYIQYIASKVNSPHSYVWLIVRKFEEAGLVECIMEGRTKIIKLTNKGEKIANKIRDVLQELSNNNR